MEDDLDDFISSENRRKIQVNVFVEESCHSISVGGGKQTFRWLAQCIQSRLLLMKSMRSSNKAERFRINALRNKGNELINPFDLIVEHLPLDINLLEVYADCQFNANIDDSGNPLYTEWESSAYVVSEEGRNWFDNLENARNQEKKAKNNEYKASEIAIGDIFLSTEESQKAFQNDRKLFNYINIFDMSTTTTTSSSSRSPTRDGESKHSSNSTNSTFSDSMYKLIASHYIYFSNLFLLFAGPGVLGRPYGITYSDYGHIIHQSKLSDFKNERLLIEKTFFEATKDTNTINAIKNSFNNNNDNDNSKNESKSESKISSYASPLMSRSQLVDGLVMLSIKFVLSNDAGNSDMHELTASEQDKVIIAVETCCQKITKLWTDIQKHYLLFQYDTILKEYRILLKSTFEAVCRDDGELSVENFITLIDHASITAYKAEAECIKAFSNALMTPSPDYMLEGVVFIEFLEACVHVALAVVDTEGLSDREKITIGLNQLI